MSKHISRPPNWKELLRAHAPRVLGKCVGSQELQTLLRHAQDHYVYWDVFRHYSFPEGITPEEAWAVLKMSVRVERELSPIKVRGEPSRFGFSYTKTLFRRLSMIDTHAAGLLQTLTAKPSAVEKNQLIISGLTEEAIASSQIEGASTSRRVAKEMLYSGRRPRNRHEQMIVNNYQVMQRLDELKDVALSEDMLLDIQRRITHDTLEHASDGGRFRTDADDIVVSDRLTGDITYIPPTQQEMRYELERLIAFANRADTQGEEYLHPVIKAAMLHFWLAYLHPFADGNGRTARAIFYWYLMKRGYWLFQYLAVSRVIKASKKKYDDAFLYAELDDNDLTYFLLYVTDATCRAIDDLIAHYEQKVREAEAYRKVVQRYPNLNERQAALLQYFVSHPDEVADIKTHQMKHGVVYETARKDLLGLKTEGFVAEVKRGYRKLFVPNMQRIKALGVR